MVSREEFQKTIRKILENHGISDKDKLESLPEVITDYFAHNIVNALMDLNSELSVQDVHNLLNRVKFIDGTEPDKQA